MIKEISQQASLSSLLAEVHQCTLCQQQLALGVRPIVQAQRSARLLIAGQAPGRKAHESGIPFDDASGDRLREWLGITREVFYDAERVAIVPMGFCYPGSGKSGDLPPRPECAPAWREKLLEQLASVELTLLLGKYAQAYHLGGHSISVTDRVKDWQKTWPSLVPLPHPSPRNNIWLKRNPWFEKELLPSLRRHIKKLLKC